MTTDKDMFCTSFCREKTLPFSVIFWFFLAPYYNDFIYPICRD